MKYLLVIGSSLALVLVAVYVYLASYIYKKSTYDNKTPSDAILVLGSRAWLGNKWDPCLFSRVSHAVDLYKAQYAPWLIMSGGVDHTGFNEAETMKDMAMSLGVPEKAIVLEKASTSTWENMVFSQKIMAAKKLNSLIVVTEPYHSPRAVLVAAKMGLNFTSSPTTSSPCWRRYGRFSRYFLREPSAIIWYKLRNRV